jgi:hypothetical protein
MMRGSHCDRKGIMRWCRHVAAVVALGLCAGSFGQTIELPMDISYYQGVKPALKAGHFYLELGAAMPIGDFGSLPALTNTVIEPFAGYAGTGGALGYTAELGTRRAFAAADHKASRTYPFWGLSVSGAHNPIDWTSLGGRWKDQEYSHFTQVCGNIQLGMVFKHNNKWVLEVHGAAMLPVLTYHPEMRLKGRDPLSPYGFLIAPDNDAAEFSPAFSGGIGIRGKRLRVGLSYFRYVAQVPYTIERAASGVIETVPFTGAMVWETMRGTLGLIF